MTIKEAPVTEMESLESYLRRHCLFGIPPGEVEGPGSGVVIAPADFPLSRPGLSPETVARAIKKYYEQVGYDTGCSKPSHSVYVVVSSRGENEVLGIIALSGFGATLYVTLMKPFQPPVSLEEFLVRSGIMGQRSQPIAPPFSAPDGYKIGFVLVPASREDFLDKQIRAYYGAQGYHVENVGGDRLEIQKVSETNRKGPQLVYTVLVKEGQMGTVITIT